MPDAQRDLPEEFTPFEHPKRVVNPIEARSVAWTTGCSRPDASSDDQRAKLRSGSERRAQDAAMLLVDFADADAWDIAGSGSADGHAAERRQRGDRLAPGRAADAVDRDVYATASGQRPWRRRRSAPARQWSRRHQFRCERRALLASLTTASTRQPASRAILMAPVPTPPDDPTTSTVSPGLNRGDGDERAPRRQPAAAGAGQRVAIESRRAPPRGYAPARARTRRGCPSTARR